MKIIEIKRTSYKDSLTNSLHVGEAGLKHQGPSKVHSCKPITGTPERHYKI